MERCARRSGDIRLALAGALRASNVDARVVVVTGPGRWQNGSFRHTFHSLSLISNARGQVSGIPGVRRGGRPVRGGRRVLPASGFLAPALRLGGYRGRIVAVEHGSMLQIHPLHRRSRLVERLDRLLGISSSTFTSPCRASSGTTYAAARP